MRCPKCGKELQENAQFCLYCMHSFKDKPNITPSKPRKTTKYLVLTAIILCAVAVIIVGCCYILQALQKEPLANNIEPPSEDRTPIETAEPEENDTTEDTVEDTTEDMTEPVVTETVETEPLYTWETVEVEGGVAVVGLKEGNDKIRDYVIPETIDGKTVVGIEYYGASIYSPWKGINTLTLPATVTYIGNRAIEHTEIESIILPEGLKTIGEYAFQGSKFKSIEIPDTVTEIGRGAFHSCREMEYIKLSSSITRIENNTFYDCQSLTEIAIPESVTYIDGLAFYCSENLADVYIYSTDIDMDEYAFDPEHRVADLTIYAREGVVREYADREYYNNSYYNDTWLAKLVVWDGTKNQ